jgi:hypothetical protein
VGSSPTCHPKLKALQVKTLQGFFCTSARKIFSIILHFRSKKNTITPFAPPFKYGRHTTSSSYWAPFPLDLWEIYVIENIGNNGNGNLRRRFGYPLLAEKNGTFSLSQMSNKNLFLYCHGEKRSDEIQSLKLIVPFLSFPIFARRMSATARNFSRTHAKSRSSKLGSSLALHSISDDKCTHTPSTRRLPRSAYTLNNDA